MPEEETTVDSNEFENFHDVAVEQRVNFFNRLFSMFWCQKFSSTRIFFKLYFITINIKVNYALQLLMAVTIQSGVIF